ncbi:MAG: dTDP-4-dehydrorhamnose 3,5-epimerase family protein [bacterium]
MIEGVRLKELKPIPDERGRVMEILRADDEVFEKFGQVYMTTAYPGVVKAWHYHKLQTDNMAVIKGMMKIVVYDSRKDSPTYGEVNEFFLGDHNFKLIQIPKMVYHGFKCIGREEAMVINVPTRPYDHRNPDEYRVDPYDNDIPYDWKLKEG